MDLLDGLVHEQAEEDHRRARGREVVLAEELVLARAGLVDLEVAGEAVGLLDRHALAQLEALGGEQVLLHVGPLRQPLPDRREVVLGRLVRGEHEHLLRPREGDVVQAHPVEQRDAVLGLEGRPVVEGPEVAVDLLRARELRVESEPTTTTGNSSPLAWWMVITCTWPLGKGWSGSSYSLMPPS